MENVNFGQHHCFPNLLCPMIQYKHWHLLVTENFGWQVVANVFMKGFFFIIEIHISIVFLTSLNNADFGTLFIYMKELIYQAFRILKLIPFKTK